LRHDLEFDGKILGIGIDPEDVPESVPAAGRDLERRPANVSDTVVSRAGTWILRVGIAAIGIGTRTYPKARGTIARELRSYVERVVRVEV